MKTYQLRTYLFILLAMVISVPSAFAQMKPIQPPPTSTLASAFSPDGKIIATGGGDNKQIYLWDAQTGEVKTEIIGTGNPVLSVGCLFISGWFADGQKFAFGNTFNQKGY